MSQPDDAAIWQRHLQPGETLVWCASVSQKDRKRAGVRSDVTDWIGIAIVIGIALAMFYRVYQWVIAGDYSSSFQSMATGPVLFLAGVGCIALSLYSLRHMKAEAPYADHFAITSNRLLALDSGHRIADQMPASEYIDLFFENDAWPTAIHVVRNDSDDSFYIEHLPDLRGVAERIREAFRERPA